MVTTQPGKPPSRFFRIVCSSAVVGVVLLVLPGCVCSSGASGYEVQGAIVRSGSGEPITAGTIEVVLESGSGPIEIISPNSSTIEGGRFVILLATTRFDQCTPFLLGWLWPQPETDIPDTPERATLFVHFEEEVFTASVEIDSSALVGIGTDLILVDFGQVAVAPVVD